MKKGFLSILATLCLCLTLLPATAMADSSTPVDVNTWAGLQAAINDNKDAKLTDNIIWGGSSLTVPTEKNVTIDLNGHSIDADSKGTAIQVCGNLIINGNQGDIITKGAATDGSPAGGIYIAPGGRVTMNGGIISNCSAGAQTATGVGGVYVSEGATFEMNAGYIAQCSGGNESNLLSSPHAASVLNYGTFTMNSNAALWGSSGGQYVSGIALYNSGTFNANGGSIGTDSSDKQLICNDNTGTLQNSANNTTTIYSAVLNYGVISGGIFNNAVTNERDGIIENGTFKGAVSNQEGGKIKGVTVKANGV